MKLKTALHFSHELLKSTVVSGDFVIDATMGNGYDTLLLAQLVGTSGKVWAFDLQESALLATQERLSANEVASQVTLFQQGHETLSTLLPEAPQPVSAAIFNLGYLPKGDKNIITQSATTLEALSSLLIHLKSGGLILLVVYYGHAGGAEEKADVFDFCKNLPQESYNVLTYQFVNQKNSPPILIGIEKK